LVNLGMTVSLSSLWRNLIIPPPQKASYPVLAMAIRKLLVPQAR
jgi:hypothetical protein